MSSFFTQSRCRQAASKRAMTVCQILRVKSFEALKLEFNPKKSEQRHLCQYPFLSVKREEETLDSVFDRRRKEMETPFTTLLTKGETG